MRVLRAKAARKALAYYKVAHGVVAPYPRQRRNRHGLSTRQPRPVSTEYPRSSRGAAATRLYGYPRLSQVHAPRRRDVRPSRARARPARRRGRPAASPRRAASARGARGATAAGAPPRPIRARRRGRSERNRSRSRRRSRRASRSCWAGTCATRCPARSSTSCARSATNAPTRSRSASGAARSSRRRRAARPPRTRCCTSSATPTRKNTSSRRTTRRSSARCAARGRRAASRVRWFPATAFETTMLPGYGVRDDQSNVVCMPATRTFRGRRVSRPRRGVPRGSAKANRSSSLRARSRRRCPARR